MSCKLRVGGGRSTFAFAVKSVVSKVSRWVYGTSIKSSVSRDTQQDRHVFREIESEGLRNVNELNDGCGISSIEIFMWQKLKKKFGRRMNPRRPRLGDFLYCINLGRVRRGCYKGKHLISLDYQESSHRNLNEPQRPSNVPTEASWL